MNWSLSEYNLICYGITDLDIFRHWAGTGSFDKSRLFEYTSEDSKTRYQNNLSGLAELPTLVVAEIAHVGLVYGGEDSPRPAFLSSIEHVHQSGRNIRFRFNHLHKISSEEIFECGYFDIEDFEAHRTHWAIKQGNLLEGFFKLLQNSQKDDHQKDDRPKFFGVEQWPLPALGHIAVMMPFKSEFDPVYEAIKRACSALHIEARRVDEIYKPTKIIDDVFSAIVQSRLVICDLTARNANVLYETGLAHARNNDVIMITQDIDDVPFDLQQFRVIKYLPNREGLSKLAEDLKKTISETLDEPILPVPESGKNPFETDKEYAEQRFIPGSEKYVSPATKGKVTFDYSNNNGRELTDTGLFSPR